MAGCVWIWYKGYGWLCMELYKEYSCVKIWYKGYGWLCMDMVQGVWLVVYGMVQGVWSCMDMVQGVIMIVVCGYRPRNIVMGLFYENVSSSFANCVIKTTNQPVLKVDLFVFPLTCLSFH